MAAPGARWLVVIAAFAAVLYAARIRHDLVDFEVYRAAGARAAAAAPLYRPDDGHFQFKYLPAFALVMTPLARLPAGAARAVWFAGSVALVVLFVSAAIGALPQRRRPRRTLAWLAVLLAGRFYVHELDLGQTNVLLGVILLAALAAARRGRSTAAGALTGLALFVKPYAAIVLPWLALTRGAAPLAGAAGVLGAGLLLPAAVYGWTGNLDLLADWYRTVAETTGPNLGYRENVSFLALWTRTVGPGEAAGWLAAASGLAALSLVFLAWRRRARVAEPDYLEAALLLLLVPLLSPQGWDYVLLLATPAILCVADRFGGLPAGWRAAAGTALAVIGFTIFDLAGRALYARLMDLSVVTLAAVALAAAVVEVRRRALA